MKKNSKFCKGYKRFSTDNPTFLGDVGHGNVTCSRECDTQTAAHKKLATKLRCMPEWCAF